MGAGASTGNPPFESEEAALAAGKTQEEIDAWKASNSSPEDSEKAAGEDAGSAEAAAAAEMAFWANLFAHRGDYSEQVEKFGVTPDYADKGNWYWCGQDGDTGPEIAPEGEQATPVSGETARGCKHTRTPPLAHFADSRSNAHKQIVLLTSSTYTGVRTSWVACGICPWRRFQTP